MSKKFEDYLSLSNHKLHFAKTLIKIQYIPETSKRVSTVFAAGKFNQTYAIQ